MSLARFSGSQWFLETFDRIVAEVSPPDVPEGLITGRHLIGSSERGGEAFRRSRCLFRVTDCQNRTYEEEFWEGLFDSLEDEATRLKVEVALRQLAVGILRKSGSSRAVVDLSEPLKAARVFLQDRSHPLRAERTREVLEDLRHDSELTEHHREIERLLETSGIERSQVMSNSNRERQLISAIQESGDIVGDDTDTDAAPITCANQDERTITVRSSEEIGERRSPRDFFISYTAADRRWAEWIAWVLEEAGYTTVLQAWDFGAGNSFVEEMQKATTESERTIAVLSEHYLHSKFTRPEWQAAFRDDPTGSKGTLVPVRVAECDVPGMLGNLVYIDVVGADKDSAEELLLRGVARGRRKPERPPAFPGGRTVDKDPGFPTAIPPQVTARDPGDDEKSKVDASDGGAVRSRSDASQNGDSWFATHSGVLAAALLGGVFLIVGACIQSDRCGCSPPPALTSESTLSGEQRPLAKGGAGQEPTSNPPYANTDAIDRSSPADSSNAKSTPHIGEALFVLDETSLR